MHGPRALGLAAPEAAALVLDRQKAFEKFRSLDGRDRAFDENKELLRQAFMEAKALGEAANAARTRIGAAKTQVENRRVERAMHGEQDASAEEVALLKTIEEQKATYQ